MFALSKRKQKHALRLMYLPKRRPTLLYSKNQIRRLRDKIYLIKFKFTLKKFIPMKTIVPIHLTF